jgi:Fe-S cluster biogenesis protein NfuA/nitrite reductase/ring-hydroxylating ferredoxin subunit
MTLAHLDPEVPAGMPGGAPEVEPLDARRVAERVGALLSQIGDSADPRITERTEDLVSVLMQFYGAGIRRMMEIADEAGMLEGDLLDRFVRDELVSGLLVIHDLHPLDLETRVQDALDRVRPYLGSHGGDVEILGIDGDVVRLRMEGSCSSCPSSTVTLNYAIEKAILEAAPEIARVEADGVEPAPQPALIQLEPRRGATAAPSNGAAAPSGTRSEWLTIGTGDRPGPSGLSAVELAGMQVLLCRAANDLYAYRDQCPSCHSALETGRLSGETLTCTACGHSFDVRLAGRSIPDGTLHLEPLPLLTEADSIRIAVPLPVLATAGGGVHTNPVTTTAAVPA